MPGSKHSLDAAITAMYRSGRLDSPSPFTLFRGSSLRVGVLHFRISKWDQGSVISGDNLVDTVLPTDLFPVPIPLINASWVHL